MGSGCKPALPRNCKRGHRNRSLGISEKTIWKAGCSNWMLGQSSFEEVTSRLAKPGNRREPHLNPFACKGGWYASLWFSAGTSLSISGAFISMLAAAPTSISTSRLLIRTRRRWPGASVDLSAGRSQSAAVRSTSGEGEAIFHLTTQTACGGVWLRDSRGPVGCENPSPRRGNADQVSIALK